MHPFCKALTSDYRNSTLIKGYCITDSQIVPLRVLLVPLFRVFTVPEFFVGPYLHLWRCIISINQAI